MAIERRVLVSGQLSGSGCPWNDRLSVLKMTQRLNSGSIDFTHAVTSAFHNSRFPPYSGRQSLFRYKRRLMRLIKLSLE